MDSSQPETSKDAPVIWNPNAAANWSIIFTPVFGAYLQASNWRSLGQAEEARKSLLWVYAGLCLLVGYFFVGFVFKDPKEAEQAARGVGLLFLIGWYFSSGRSQSDYVKRKFNGDYQRRTWGMPLLVGIACLAGYRFLAMAVAGLLTGAR